MVDAQICRVTLNSYMFQQCLILQSVEIFFLSAYFFLPVLATHTVDTRTVNFHVQSSHSLLIKYKRYTPTQSELLTLNIKQGAHAETLVTFHILKKKQINCLTVSAPSEI